MGPLRVHQHRRCPGGDTEHNARALVRYGGQERWRSSIVICPPPPPPLVTGRSSSCVRRVAVTQWARDGHLRAAHRSRCSHAFVTPSPGGGHSTGCPPLPVSAHRACFVREAVPGPSTALCPGDRPPPFYGRQVGMTRPAPCPYWTAASNPPERRMFYPFRAFGLLTAYATPPPPPPRVTASKNGRPEPETKRMQSGCLNCRGPGLPRTPRVRSRCGARRGGPRRVS